MKKTVNFLTIGDKNYFDSIFLSAKQIKKFYPESSLFIYDWGFENKQKRQLKAISNVNFVNWKIKKKSLIKKYIWFVLKHPLLFIQKKNLRALVNIIRNYKKEILLINKVLCFKHFSRKTKSNFIFLDGDAVLTGSIDAVFKYKFDVGVTLRRMKEIDYTFGKCRVLNSGVLFFLGGYANNIAFINNWIEKMYQTVEPAIEQTSLTRLLLNAQKKYKYYQTVKRNNNGKIFKILILPCEKYNYNWIEEGYDLNKQKILHFKSGRYTKKLYYLSAKNISG